MTPIEFNCPKCGQKLTADKSLCQSITLCPVCEQAIRVPQFNLKPGIQIGDFILKEKLGVGGMGEVWLSEQKSMQRETALKILAPELADNDEFCVRFQHEAKNSGKLLHPNIVTAFYAGVEDNIHYLAMSYVDGIPLDVELELSKTIPEKKALHIALEVAAALKYAWDRFKIIHRDIKPSNIMLARDGCIKLLDLGISKSITDNDMLTKTGLFVGTPYYVSPEQAKNEATVDFRSDMYSLGAVLFHMLTGEFPYMATTPLGVVAQHLSEPLPDLRSKNPQISVAVCELVQKMMQKNRDLRFASWDELISAIHGVLNPVELPPPVPVEASDNTRLRFSIMIGTAVLVVVAAGFMLFRALVIAPSENEDHGTEELSTLEDASTPDTVNSSEPKMESAKKAENTSAPVNSEATPKTGGNPPPANNNRIPNLFPDMHFMKNILGLSPAQMQEMNAIREDFKTQAISLHEKIKEASPMERQRLWQELSRQRDAARQQGMRILTEEQRRKLNAWDEQRKKNNEPEKPRKNVSDSHDKDK